MYLSYSVVEALMLVTALSMDSFVSAFAYGSDKIKIPIKSVVVINGVCTFFFALSLLAGTLFQALVPEGTASVICFVILFTLGVIKIFDSTVKSLIRKYNKISKNIKFSISNLHFILNIYANPEDADMDSSRELSMKEAVYLAVALSLDGLAVGFGAGMTGANYPAAIIFSFFVGMLAVMLGCYAGNKVSEKFTPNLSWQGGLILMLLAFGKL